MVARSFLLGSVAVLLVLLGILPVAKAASRSEPALLLPCFPGARGFGSSTPGGRGGQVLKVVNLNDSGPGSLRAALAVSGPRIVVFEVGGNIRLDSALRIEQPYVTLAGQTAPSPGITLYGAGLHINSHDIVLQHLRIRVGDLAGGRNPLSLDGLQLAGLGTWNLVADHLSISWAVDENIALWGGAHDITISNCIVSEGLRHSIHPKGPHSMGMLIGDHVKNVTVLNNLFAHNNARNPRIKGGATAVVVNNLIYNGGQRYVAIGSPAGPNLVTLVGNRMIPGPDTLKDTAAVNLLDSMTPGSKVYLFDNDATGMGYRLKGMTVFFPPLWHATLAPFDSHLVEAQVLAMAGARPQDRDGVDARIASEVAKRNGRIIDSPAQIEGGGTEGDSARPFVVPADPHGDDDLDGYTNLEERLQQMAAQVESGL